MFASVLVALAGHAESRDALVLAAQLAGDDGTIIVAHVMMTTAAPLTGGSEAAARRRAGLRDAGEEVYATLGPDPRVRFLPISGVPFAEGVRSVIRRERTEAVVLGQNLLGHEPDARELLASGPCPVAIAPYGHRFVRAFAPARITVACGPPGPADGAVSFAAVLAERVGAQVRLIVAGEPRAEDWLAHAQAIAPAAAATRVTGRGAAALVAQTRGDVDVLVVGAVDDELLRQASCPVLVVAAAARASHPVAA